VFGSVIDQRELLEDMVNRLGDEQGRPRVKVQIANCIVVSPAEFTLVKKKQMTKLDLEMRRRKESAWKRRKSEDIWKKEADL